MNPECVQEIIKLLKQKYTLGVPILAILEALAKPEFSLDVVAAQSLINKAQRTGLVSRHHHRYYATQRGK
jgi:hypothetical protein